MQYSKLGSSGIEVSRVCLGTMTWGRQNNEEQGHAQMDYALERGVNFWDTAEMYAVPAADWTYGQTESIIGSWFHKTGKRDQVILATKVAGPGLPWIREGKAKIDGENIKEAVEGSLQRLQTDYIDLYQLHWPNRPFPHLGNGNHAGMLDFSLADTEQQIANFLDVLRTLETCIQEGKIRHIGLSDDTAWGISKYVELAKAHNLPIMTSIQNEFSLLKRVDDPYVVETCLRENVAYLPWSPLAMGLISGKYKNGARPEGTRWIEMEKDGHPPGYGRDNPVSGKAVDGYIDVAGKHGLDVCQMALKFVDQQSFVTSTIIGATSMEQLKIDIDAFDLPPLSEEVLADIDAVYRQYPIPF